MRLWLGRHSHVHALILNTSARDAWRRLPRDSAVPPATIRPPGSSPEPPRPGWSQPPTAGLQICRRRATDSLSEAVYVKEQVCIRCRCTHVYYTAKLTFSHDFPIKVWGAYCTSVRIIFEFLRYMTDFYRMHHHHHLTLTQRTITITLLLLHDLLLHNALSLHDLLLHNAPAPSLYSYFMTYFSLILWPTFTQRTSTITLLLLTWPAFALLSLSLCLECYNCP